MKRFLYSSPELGFIVLVMALPLVVGFARLEETVWGFLGTVVFGMIIGFGIWLSVVFLACRRYDRKKRNQ